MNISLTVAISCTIIKPLVYKCVYIYIFHIHTYIRICSMKEINLSSLTPSASFHVANPFLQDLHQFHIAGLRSPVELARSFPLPFPLKLFVNTSRAEAAAVLHGQVGDLPVAPQFCLVAWRTSWKFVVREFVELTWRRMDKWFIFMSHERLMKCSWI